MILVLSLFLMYLQMQSWRTFLSCILFFIFFTTFYLFDLTFGYSVISGPKSHLTPSKNIGTPLEITNHFSNIDDYEAIDRTVERFAHKWGLAGASVAIAHNGELLYAKGIGFANKETNEHVQPYHLFRIASVSKLITAITIMKLVDQNKIDLHQTIFGPIGILNEPKYSNYIDKRVEQITVEHLLNHSAGWSTRWGDHLFMHQSIARQLEKELPLGKDDIIQFALSKRLHYNPGNHSSYNNLGYLILERVIEKVTTKSYEHFVKESILAPIGVYDAFIAFNFDSLRYPYEVRYYEVPEAELVPAFDGSPQMLLKCRGGNDIRTLGAAGGWVISSVSLIKILLAIDPQNNQQKIITSKSARRLTQTQPGLHPLGWRWISGNGNKWRTGSFAGSSALALARSDGFTYVFLTNSSPWVGSKFPYEVDKMMTKAIQSVDNWPSIDLLNPDKMFIHDFLKLPWQSSFGADRDNRTILERLSSENS